MTYRAMHPVRSLIFAVRGILQTGNFGTRIPEQPQRGELSALTQLFNRMLDKNEHLINAMHEALDNVAHDLRTPMTHLRNAAEFSLQSPDNHEAQREALADCMEESDRVLEMLRVLMDLAEATTGTMQLNIERIAVDQIVAEVVDVYSIVAEERRLQLDVDVPEGCPVDIDRSRIRQVLANLLDNAMKYSPEGTMVAASRSRVR